MKNRKITAIMALLSFVLSLCACAGVPLQEKAGDKKAKPKSAQQLKFEQEEEARALLIKSISSFSGLVLGGLIGLLTSPKSNVVASSIGGCVAGGALGFGLGMLIFENTKPGEKKPDDAKVRDYFQDYRNIQLKE